MRTSHSRGTPLRLKPFGGGAEVGLLHGNRLQAVSIAPVACGL